MTNDPVSQSQVGWKERYGYLGRDICFQAHPAEGRNSLICIEPLMLGRYMRLHIVPGMFCISAYIHAQFGIWNDHCRYRVHKREGFVKYLQEWLRMYC